MSFARFLIPLTLIPTLTFAPLGVQAATSYQQARVINAEPRYETVTYTVPVEQCRLESVPVNEYRDDGYQRRSYTAPIVGAIIGGALGNAVMHGKTKKRTGTAVGAVLGASIGADVSRQRAPYRDYPGSRVSYRQQEVCETVEEVREERTISGYRVRYQFAGETYVTHMDRDPGRFLKVRVDVTPV